MPNNTINAKGKIMTVPKNILYKQNGKKKKDLKNLENSNTLQPKES